MKKKLTLAASAVVRQYLAANVVEYVRCPLTHCLILRSAATGAVARQACAFNIRVN